jgi:hypothetical protein
MPATYQSVRDRIAELSQLEDGWFDGEQGVAANPEGLRWLQDRLLAFGEFLLPWVFPSSDPEFDVSLEWLMGDWEVSLWVNTKTKYGEWYSFDVDGGSGFYEYCCDLSMEESWQKIEKDLVATKHGE